MRIFQSVFRSAPFSSFRGPVLSVFFLSLLLTLLTVGPLGCEGCSAGSDVDGGSTEVNLSPDPLFIVDGGIDPSDSGVERDAGDGNDNADGGDEVDAGNPIFTPDAGDETDAGNIDVLDAGPSNDAGITSCDFSQLPPEGDRVVVVSHPFGNDGPWDLRTLELKAGGTLADVGARFPVGQKVRQLAFVPSGEVLLALGEGGELYSFWVDDVDALTLVDTLTLPDAGFDRRIEMLPSGDTALIANFNSSATSGIFRVFIQCDGTLLLDENAFFPLRLISAMTLTADKSRLIVVGGQATFEPVDADELRIFSFDQSGFQQVGAFDFFQDSMVASRISMRDDGLLAVPSSLSFSNEFGQVRFFQLNNDVLTQVDLIENTGSLREVLFSPDGQSLILSRDEDNALSMVVEGQNGWEVSSEYTGVALADQMAMIRRGPLSGHLLLPAVNRVGTIHHVVIGPQMLSGLDSVPLGGSTTNIPWGIAVQP